MVRIEYCALIYSLCSSSDFFKSLANMHSWCKITTTVWRMYLKGYLSHNIHISHWTFKVLTLEGRINKANFYLRQNRNSMRRILIFWVNSWRLKLKAGMDWNDRSRWSNWRYNIICCTQPFIISLDVTRRLCLTNDL